MRSSMTAAVLAATLAGPLSAQTGLPPKEFADPVAALQGEWVTRFCDKDFRWKVEGMTVKMLAHDPKKPATDYDNRYPVGATVKVLTTESDRNDRMVRWRAQEWQPDGTYGSILGYAALTAYTSDPNGNFAKSYYLSLNEMIRPAEKLKQCK